MGYYLDFTITLKSLSRLHGLGGTRVANKLADRLKIEKERRPQVVADAFEVSFQWQRYKFFRWAPSAVRQADWADQMAQLFEESFGWKSIRTDLERVLAAE